MFLAQQSGQLGVFLFQVLLEQVVGSRWIYKVRQRSDGLFVSQGKYAWEILEKFNMHGGKHVLRYLRGISGYGLWYR